MWLFIRIPSHMNGRVFGRASIVKIIRVKDVVSHWKQLLYDYIQQVTPSGKLFDSRKENKNSCQHHMYKPKVVKPSSVLFFISTIKCFHLKPYRNLTEFFFNQDENLVSVKHKISNNNNNNKPLSYILSNRYMEIIIYKKKLLK